jgi:hypothetical protein
VGWRMGRHAPREDPCIWTPPPQEEPFSVPEHIRTYWPTTHQPWLYDYLSSSGHRRPGRSAGPRTPGRACCPGAAGGAARGVGFVRGAERQFLLGRADPSVPIIIACRLLYRAGDAHRAHTGLGGGGDARPGGILGLDQDQHGGTRDEGTPALPPSSMPPNVSIPFTLASIPCP